MKSIIDDNCVLYRSLFIFLIAVALFFFTSTVQAAPWWWTQFTRGDDVYPSNSNYERWVTEYVTSAQSSDDVWMASYTWGSEAAASNAVINGIKEDNKSGGLNHLYQRRQSQVNPEPVRILGDEEHREINNFLLGGVPREFSTGGGHSHHKVILLGDRSLMVGSANMNGGAFTQQPNNMTIFRNMPALNGVFREELNEQFSGVHFDNTPVSRNRFTAPTGQTVRAYYAPDDHNHINLKDGGTGLYMAEVLAKETRQADESIFGLYNQFYLDLLAEAFEDATASGKLVEGLVANSYDELRNSLKKVGTFRANDGLQSRMHHKVMIFDQEIVAFGSANHSPSAMRNTRSYPNEENLVVVEDFRMARRYMQEYRRVMSLMSEENVGQSDSFETTSPGSPTNLTAENITDRSHSLKLSWTAPTTNIEDFSRYYVFVANYELYSDTQIGDGQDADGDHLIDEDPRGNVDGFASGPDMNSLSPDDDDADGRIDEDPWMYPEKQIKVDNPGAVTSTTLTTFNVEEELPNNEPLWIGLVAVDKHGNESDPVFFGPVRSRESNVNIAPGVEEFAYAEGASRRAGETTTLNLTVANSSTAGEAITALEINLGSGSRAFTPRSQIAANYPAGYSTSTTDSSIVISATGDGIGSGNQATFKLSVTNPDTSGTSEAVTVDAEDASGNTVSGLTAGSLEVEQAEQFPGIQAVSVADANRTLEAPDGSKKLSAPPYSFEISLVEAADTEVSIYWDAEATPDGPGGSDSDEKLTLSGSGTSYSGSLSDDPELAHGNEIKFIVVVDGNKVYLNGEPFSFVIDRAVSKPGLEQVIDTGYTTVALDISPVTDSDFQEYRLYYSSGGGVTKDDNYHTYTTKNLSEITVDRLNSATTYSFALSAVDSVGNESTLSSAFTVTTLAAVEITDIRVVNGERTKTVTTLDGSAEFFVEPLVVKVTFDKKVTGEVKLFYDVGDNPDGSLDGNTEERMREAMGSDTYFEIGIPGDDPEFQPGKVLKFVLQAGAQVLGRTTPGDPFKISFKETIPVPGGLNVVDTGAGTVKLGWSSVNYDRFGQYRIFYTTVGDTPDENSTSWGAAEDISLALSNTEQTVIDYLAPGKSYRFRIAVLGEGGRLGQLSTMTQVASPAAEDSLLFTELAPHSSPRWVELTSRTNGLDVSDFYLSSLAGETEPLARDSLQLAKDEKVVLRFTSGTSETGNSGDLNGNGALDLYLPGAASFALADTVDQLVLFDDTGETIDAVVYRLQPGTDFDAAEQADVEALHSDHWDSKVSPAALNIYDRASLSSKLYLARNREFEPYGEFEDSNSRGDWALTTRSTPGKDNQFPAVDELTVTDRAASDGQWFTQTAYNLDDNEKLKFSAYRFKFDLNQPVAADSGLYLWYDTDATPKGFSTPDRGESIALAPTAFESGGDLVDTRFTLAGLSHGDQVKFGLSLLPTPETVSAVDETYFGPYSYGVDTAAPPAPGNLRSLGQREAGLIVGWNPPESVPSDFSAYRLFYDTGTVTKNSDSLKITDYQQSSALVELPPAADTWHLRLGSVDKIGNGSRFDKLSPVGLSDTLSLRRLPPINVSDLWLEPNNPESLTAGVQPGDPVKVKVLFDRRTTDPYLVWDKNDATSLPDSGADNSVALNKKDNRLYKGTIPAAGNKDVIQFVFNTDGGVLDNNGSAYQYTVDTAASPPVPRFTGDDDYTYAYQEPNTDIFVGWSPLPDTVTDFSQYRIAYARGKTVDTTASYLGPGKNSSLTDKLTSSSLIKGLDRADTYAFGIYWLDEAGNYSAMSDTFYLVTPDAQPSEDPAYDGKFVAHALDGSEYLRKSDIEIHFEFSLEPARPGDVKLHYSIGGNPASADASVVEMQKLAGSDKTYSATIPESPAMTEGTTVSYFIKEGPWKFTNNGGNFKFKIDEFKPPDISNFVVSDDGDRLFFYWNPLSNNDDFSEYRIRYRRPGESGWHYHDSSDQSALGSYTTSSAAVEGLNSTANYYYNMTVVDKLGRVNYRTADRLLLRDTGGEKARLEAVGPEVFTASPGDTVELAARLWDMFDSPWYDRPVDFSVLDGSFVRFVQTADTAQTVHTGSRGRAVAEMEIISGGEGYATVEAVYEGRGGPVARKFIIRVFNDSTVKEKSRVVPFQK